METTIQLINIVDYVKDGKEKSCLKFIFVDKDKFQENDSFLGYTECTLFYNKHLRQLFSRDCFKDVIKAKIVSQPSLANPMKVFNTIESVDINGKIINLL